MINFLNDYSVGAAPEVLDDIVGLSGESFLPYGGDRLCQEAKKLIAFDVERDDIDIHFLTGGTQANLTVISSVLRGHEAVLASEWGHIATHETGAVEATGHKVVTVPHHNGKVIVEDIKKALSFNTGEHMVKIKLIYISQTTEWGTVYTKNELEELSEFAHENGLWLYIDGARLGSALTASDCDFTMRDIAEYADIFTIGGTKNGALFGEAVVITRQELKADFRYYIKQKGGLLAKGWLLGSQFISLFRDGLFYRLAEHGNAQAAKIREAMMKEGIPLASASRSNQLFPILPLSLVVELSQDFLFEIIDKVGEDRAVVRFVCSWATDDTSVVLLESALAKYNYVEGEV